jgi:hypothetical protein
VSFYYIVREGLFILYSEKMNYENSVDIIQMLLYKISADDKVDDNLN